MDHVNSVFEELGASTAAMWGKELLSEASFPSVANSVLKRFMGNCNLAFTDVVNIVMLNKNLPEQNDIFATFGQPPVTVYRGQGFRIELLFWTEGTPSIHQHAFYGAFSLLIGRSVHVLWSFQTSDTSLNRLHTGRLHFRQAELLEAGDVRSIIAGDSQIHATYHLDNPSVTCVIRTDRDSSNAPQFFYAYPSIRFSTFDIRPLERRRAQILNMLLQTRRRSEIVNHFDEIIETGDMFMSFYCLYDAGLRLEDDLACTVIRLVELRYPALNGLLGDVIEHVKRRERITRLRKATSNSDMQFFLALLLNVPSRDAILQLVREQFTPRDPCDVIVGWVAQLESSSNSRLAWPTDRRDALIHVLRNKQGDDELKHMVAGLSEPVAGTRATASGAYSSSDARWLLKPLLSSSL